MGEFKSIVGTFLITSILVFSLFSFILVMQEDNNAPNKLKDNSVFNDSFSVLSDTIISSTEDAEDKYSVFNDETPKQGFGSIVLFGIVSVGKTFSNIVFGTFSAIIKLPLVVLGFPLEIYNIILTWLIISVIVAVWLLYKYGG